MPKIYSLYNRPDPVLQEVGKSMTQQHHAEDADINTIMNRYIERGVLPLGRVGQPMFGDFSGDFSLQSAQDAIIEAKDKFYELPSKIRAKFKNDPFKLIDFIENVDNQDEAISLGLIEEPEGWIPPEDRKRFREPEKETQKAPESVKIEDRELQKETD